ncbi:MAG: signal recognition particle protein [Desulfovibrio sp.]|jgi:signal recognition particle subunit SRP54|nr:signal recognition particle protein [Desulfovibrio sp.]
MFDSLSDRISHVFRTFGGRAQLNESNIQDSLAEVRLALLEADVSLPIVKEFIERVRERCLGNEVAKRLNPAQQVVKIVHEELVVLLGGDAAGLNLTGAGPHIIMMVGLQGSGKTTSTGKLAYWLRAGKHTPYLVPADVYRPAAIEQLTMLAEQLGMPCYPSTTLMNPVDIAEAAVREAARLGCDVVLLDTAGRLHIDEALMRELKGIKSRVPLAEILFVADAMTGQDAVTVASAFNDALDITGVVLTKMDGDARGGAALSIKSTTGKNVKFVGMGEKIAEFEPFMPDRVAGRILGMGDMLTLIEKAQTAIEADEAEELARKFQKAEFDFEDFRVQMRRMKKLGSLEGLLQLIPGMGAIRRKIGDMAVPEKEMSRVEAIINSMTRQERHNPTIINAGRKQRIARGSGVRVAQVNQLLKQFDAMRGMMQRFMGGKLPGGMPGMSSRPTRLPGAGVFLEDLGKMPGIPGMPGMPLPGLSGGVAFSEQEQKKLRQKRKEERQRKKKNRK